MAVLMEFIQKVCGKKMLQLVGNAHVITPNLTEALLLLYGKEGMEKRYASLLELDGRKRLEQIGKIGEQLKKEYGLQAAVITGVESKRNVLVVLQEVSVISTQKLSRTSEQTEKIWQENQIQRKQVCRRWETLWWKMVICPGVLPQK